LGSNQEVVLPILEFRRALLDERRHALRLIVRGEQRVEHAPLEAHAPGERRREGAGRKVARRRRWGAIASPWTMKRCDVSSCFTRRRAILAGPAALF